MRNRIGNLVQDANCPGAWIPRGQPFSVVEQHATLLESQQSDLNDLKESVKYLIDLVQAQSDLIESLTMEKEDDAS